MEIVGDAAPTGGCSIRDLPPSKRFKFVGANLGSALPAKKRALPPLPEAAPVLVCLPAKKRAYAYAPAVAEQAAKACLPVKKRAYAPPVDAIPPACLPAKTRDHAHPPPPKDAARPPSAPPKKIVQAPSRQEDVAAFLYVRSKKHGQMSSRLVASSAGASVPAKKRVLAPSPLGRGAAAAPPTVPANKRVQAPPPSVTTKQRVTLPPCQDRAVAASSIPAKQRDQVPWCPEATTAPPSVQAKKRIQAPSLLEDAAAPPPIPAKQRVLVPSCTEGAVAAPSVPAKQRVLVPSRPEGVALPLSVMANKGDHSPSALEDPSALFPVSLPANKRVMSQFIPPRSSPSMKSNGDLVAAAKEAWPEGSIKSSGAINPAVANGAADCTRAEASKMPDTFSEVKEQVVKKSRRANAARKASDVHCKKLSDVISGMQSEVQAEVVETFEQLSDAHCKELSNVGIDIQSEVLAEVPESFEQVIDVPCKELSDVVNGVRSEVKDEVLKTPEQASELHCKKLPDVVSGKHSEVQAEELKSLEQASDVHCKKLPNAKQSEVEAEVLKTIEQVIDPEVAAQACEEEPKKENEVAEEPKQDALVEAEDDDGILCAVCRSTDGDASDPIVFCDGCDLMVHATCYGNPLAQSIPDGDWFCSLCSHKATAATAKKGKPARPPCCLCPGRGGAMKRTTDGAWAHIECALLVPEVFFQDPDGREDIDCSLVPGRRFTKQCYLCETGRGCALECSQPKCNLGFHVSCGLNGGLCIEYREEKGGAIVAGFCMEHTKIWEKQQLTGKYKIVSRGHA